MCVKLLPGQLLILVCYIQKRPNLSPAANAPVHQRQGESVCDLRQPEPFGNMTYSVCYRSSLSSCSTCALGDITLCYALQPRRE